MSGYVICSLKVTSPAPDQPWIEADVPCGLKVEMPDVPTGAVVQLRCARGHEFFVTAGDEKVDPHLREHYGRWSA